MKIYASIGLFLLLSCNVYAEISIQDDSGHTLVFAKPVQKIISLAPHITETLFAAGASDQVIATVTYSDYPEQARQIPVIGDHNKYDFEAILKLEPELIIAWKSGNPVDQLSQLKALGFKVFESDPFSLDNVASSIQAMGRLMGTESVANAAAFSYRHKLKQLALKYSGQSQLKVFYQVWDEPLITVNKKHLINQVIQLCGGSNVFGDLSSLAPRVSIEAVLTKNPDLIVTGMASGREKWLDNWRSWKDLNAVKNNHLFAINADWITRHTPRILLGVEKMCDYFDGVRKSL